MRHARAVIRSRARTHLRGLAGACALACTLVSAVACAPAARAPRPAPTAAAPPAHDPLEAPWTMARGTGPFANTLRFTSELVSRVDSVQRHDSSHAVVVVAWSRPPLGGPARLSGLVRDFRVGEGSGDLRPLPALRLPVPFAALGGDGGEVPRIEVPPSGACGLAAAALQPLRELFVSPPPSVEVGTAWSDSSNYTLCRDSIPLAVTSVRRYRVVGAERRATGVVVLIDRSSRVTLFGEGAQFGERLSLAGEGAGTMRLALDPASSTVVAGHGDTELRLTMRGRRRSQDLRQHTRIEITSP